jgi:O-antigen ligase
VNASPAIPSRQSVLPLRLTALWAAGGAAFLLLAPLTAPAILLLCVVAPLAWYWAAEKRPPLYAPSSLILAMIVAGAYLLVNASWSLSRVPAMQSVAVFFAVVAVLHMTLNTLGRLNRDALRVLAAGSLAGMLAAGAILCVEVFSDQWLHRLLLSHVPALRPNSVHMQVDAGHVTMLASYLLNRSVTMLVLLFWPAVLMLGAVGFMRSRPAQLLTLALVVATILWSASATAGVAFAGAAATFGMLRLFPLLAKRLLLAGWAAACLLVVPAVSLLYSTELYHASWLPESARHRVVIWGHTARQVANAPFLGVGIGTARAVNDRTNPNVPLAPGTTFKLSTSLHSHNAYLQVWYEAGAVGALMLLGLGLLVLRSLGRAPAEVQPHLHAAFVAGALVAASGFSLWAPWFMAALAIAAIYAGLGAAFRAAASRR